MYPSVSGYGDEQESRLEGRGGGTIVKLLVDCLDFIIPQEARHTNLRVNSLRQQDFIFR